MTDPQAITLRAKMLGAMLREARLSADKSISKMASLIGTTRSTISSYERGRKAISLPELELFAYHLELPLSHFLSTSIGRSKRKTDFDPTTIITLRQRIIGALLRKHRQETGLSIRALAETSKLPAWRISTFERGIRPIPLPQLEVLLTAVGHSIDIYIDHEGPIGEWIKNEQAFERLLELPIDLREFLIKPGNQAYLRMAKQLSELSVEKLRSLAEGLLDLTL